MSTLYELAEGVRTCTSCHLWKSRMLPVPGEGKGKIMFISDYPREEDDRHGVLFMGDQGRIFANLLKIAKLKREDVYVTSVVKCHGDYGVNELRKCKQLWLDRQIEAIDPSLIILMGNVTARMFFGDIKLSEEHGKMVEDKFFLTFHPSAGLKLPKINEMMEQDFKKLGQVISNLRN